MFSDEEREPLLSDEETSALLDAMREDDKSAVTARDADLTSPDGALRHALGRADACAEDLARIARIQLLRMTTCSVTGEPLSTEITPRDVFQSSLPPSAMRFGLSSAGYRQGELALAPSLCRFVLERAMGAAPQLGDNAAAPAPDRFSELDRRLLTPFAAAIVGELSEGLLADRPLTLREPEEDVDPAGPVRFEPILRLGLRFGFEGMPVGELWVALESSAMSAKDSEKSAPRAPAAQSVGLRLARAEVDVAAVLGRTASSVRDLLSLQVGDVLRLDGAPGEPVGLWVDDVLIARGMPVVHVGDLAIEVTHAK